MNPVTLPAWRGSRPNARAFQTSDIPGFAWGLDASKASAVKSDGAAEFIRTNSEYLSASGTSDLDIGTQDFAFACWVKRTDIARWAIVACKGDNVSDNSYLFGVNGSSDQLNLIISNGAADITVSGTTTINDTNWHLIVLNADRDGNATFYIDGSSSPETGDISSKQGTLTNTDNFEVGRDRSQAVYSDAIFDSLFAWVGRTLTTAEIDFLYNSGNGRKSFELDTHATLSDYAEAFDFDEGPNVSRIGRNGVTLTDNNGVDAANGVIEGDLDDDSLVSRFVDISPNANDLTQSTPASKPTFQAAAINSRGVVALDGSDDTLSVASAAAIEPTAFSLFVVARLNVALASQPGALPVLIDKLSGNNGYRLYFNKAGNALRMRVGDGVDTQDAVTTSTHFYIGTTVFLVTVTFNGATISLEIDGAGGGESDTQAQGAIAYSSETLYLGSQGDSSNYVDGEIGEVALYNRVLTTGEIARVQNAMAAKWGVTLS